MSDHYIYLPSNVDSDSENTCAKYTTLLPKTLRFEGKYEVGLVEISFTKSWFNIPQDMPISFILRHNDSEAIEFVDVATLNRSLLKRGYYSSVNQVAEEINFVLKNSNLNIHYNLIETPKIFFNQNAHKWTIYPGRFTTKFDMQGSEGFSSGDIIPTFGENNKFFGFNPLNDEYSMESVIESGQPFDSDSGIRNLFVYSNIVERSVLGNTLSNIIRIVEPPPASIPFGDQFNVKYENVHYVPLSTSEVREIEIHIRNDKGDYVPFQFGRTVVVLHIRPRNV